MRRILLMCLLLVACGSPIDINPLDVGTGKPGLDQAYKVSVTIVNKDDMSFHFSQEADGDPKKYAGDTHTTVIIPANEKYVDVAIRAGRRAIAPRYYCRVEREPTATWTIWRGQLDCPGN